MIAYDWEESLDSHFPFYDLIFYKKSVSKLLSKNIATDQPNLDFTGPF